MMNSLSMIGRSIFSMAALLAAIVPPVASAQPPSQPKFDVSSIRTSDPNAGHGMSLSANGDSLKAHNVTLFMLIRTAYGLSDDQISGGPDWIRSSRFDISAKTDTPVDPKLQPDEAQASQRQMFQQLLAERFQLRLHHQTKDIPGYEMVVARNGPRNLTADEAGITGFSGHDGKIHATAITMDQFASLLGQRIIEAPLKNGTGLAGKFDLDLTWDEKQSHAAAAADAPASDAGPSIFLALQQQLGLRLEEHKTPADAIVIENAQMPQEN